MSEALGYKKNQIDSFTTELLRAFKMLMFPRFM